MKVILMRDVPSIGHKDDIKEVKNGYARNFLLPQEFAVPATVEAISALERRKKHEADSKEKDTALIEIALKELAHTPLSIPAKANEKGVLFKKIGVKDIKEGLHKAGFSAITEDDILLKEPLKEIGEHAVIIRRGDRSVELRIHITAVA